MRVLITLGVLVLIFLVGAKTEWMSVATAEQTMNEDRAFEAAVLGQTRPDATSGELIDAAFSRGEISSEQALLYGVYLACDDSRLPAQFRGRDVAAHGTDVLREADVDWAALSPETQRALHAFFNQGGTALARLSCRDELARLKDDAKVWWAPALGHEQAPVVLANTQ